MDNYLHFVAAVDVQKQKKEQEQQQEQERSVEPWIDLEQKSAPNQLKRFSGVLN